MKLYYRAAGGEAEILRCEGTDPDLVIPAEIEGIPVTKAADYAFSAGEEPAGENVRVFETEEYRMFCGGGHLLAGNGINSITFPDSMETVGRYAFYGCRNLKRLEFSDRLVNIGSGAFTGCRSLNRLRVHLTEGRRSCVCEILGDLWQRIDVEFYGREEARLVFPEHYEEAVENTPARILFTQHHGSGNNYRQCFYSKEADCRKYDELFPVAKAQERIPVLCDLVFSRLMYPAGLTEGAARTYMDYIREQEGEIVRCLIDSGSMERLEFLSRRKLWEEETLREAAEYAAERKAEELLSFLIDERHRLFPGKRKKYEL